MKPLKYLALCLLPFGFGACNGDEPAGGDNGGNGGEGGTTPTVSKVYNNVEGLIPDCADPFVLKYGDRYYCYGTGGDATGIKCYISTNMAVWTDARGATDGYALHEDDVFGDNWFWAPEVYYNEADSLFYMYYSANERLSVATARRPEGPFKQTVPEQVPLHDAGEIDSHLFVDDDGSKYLYYVRFTNGNEIWVAELNDDMRTIREETLTHCLGPRDADAGAWEWDPIAVNEGPFVLKHNGTYYLTYSGNSYQTPYYAVGYATSDSPMGPWTRYAGNPILIGNDELKGTGHHSFVTKSEGCGYIVYHAWNNTIAWNPRKLCIDTYEFVPNPAGGPDILQVNGPTTTDQEVCD